MSSALLPTPFAGSSYIICPLEGISGGKYHPAPAVVIFFSPLVLVRLSSFISINIIPGFGVRKENLTIPHVDKFEAERQKVRGSGNGSAEYGFRLLNIWKICLSCACFCVSSAGISPVSSPGPAGVLEEIAGVPRPLATRAH